MNSLVLTEILGVLDDLQLGGYEHFMNYAVVRRLLSDPQSALTKLFDYVLVRRPQMDIINLVCTVNGALSYVAVNLMSPDDALSCFEDERCFDTFIKRYSARLEQVALARSNNPTIPQRALSVASVLPQVNADVGLLELGCSRGDIGLVLLNLEKVLGAPSKYLFPDFVAAVSTDKLQHLRMIDQYFGVDIDISTDDGWLLALWGLRDERRRQLQSFYTDFKPDHNDRFQRFQADACDLQAYGDQALEFFRTSKHLIVLTSFMMYQLSSQDRRELAGTVRAIQSKFLETKADSAFALWLNQGMHPKDLLNGKFDFSHCYLSKLWFDGKKLLGLPLVRLSNDACEGWNELDALPVVVDERS